MNFFGYYLHIYMYRLHNLKVGQEHRMKRYFVSMKDHENYSVSSPLYVVFHSFCSIKPFLHLSNFFTHLVRCACSATIAP